MATRVGRTTGPAPEEAEQCYRSPAGKRCGGRNAGHFAALLWVKFRAAVSPHDCYVFRKTLIWRPFTGSTPLPQTPRSKLPSQSPSPWLSTYSLAAGAINGSLRSYRPILGPRVCLRGNWHFSRASGIKRKRLHESIRNENSEI
jgi:hypothetical protein